MLAVRTTFLSLFLALFATPSFALGNESVDEAISSYLGEFEKREEKPWTLKGGFGFTFKDGNTELVNVAANADFQKQWQTFLLKLAASSIYTVEDGEETASEHILQERVEWFLGEKNRLFQAAWLETDSDESLAWRFWLTFGYGRQLKKTEVFEMWGDVGLGYEWERYYGQSTNGAPFLVFQIDWDWQVTKTLLYEQIFRWQQYFEDGGRFKAYAEAKLSMPLSQRWSLAILARDEFNSDPEPGNEKNDTTLLITLNFNFTGDNPPAAKPE